jgi:hypothetical protein
MARSELVPIDQAREVVAASMRVPAVADEVHRIQVMTSPGPSRLFRRMLFLWFRVYVRSHREGRKEERVDVRIPVPLPLIGLIFPWRIGWKHALAAVAGAHSSDDPPRELRTYLESVMALEIVRVENERPGKRELVVIGFD